MDCEHQRNYQRQGAYLVRNLLAACLFELPSEHVRPLLLILVIFAVFVDAKLGLYAVDGFVADVFLPTMLRGK